MKVNLHRISVGPNKSVVMPRPKFKNANSATPVSRPIGTFWVPTSPIIAGKPVSWQVTRTGDHVRIPIVDYTVKASGPEGIMFAGTELGMRAINNLMVAKNFTPQQAANWEVAVVFGDAPESTADNEGWEYRVGLSIRTE